MNPLMDINEWNRAQAQQDGSFDAPDPYGQPFVVKDSGKREEFDSGMVRDTEDGKADETLVYDGPMFERQAIHLTKGAVKYAKRNWMQARTEYERDRFMRSLARHFRQYVSGLVDEDHAAAIFFNINGAEYVKQRLADPLFDLEMALKYNKPEVVDEIVQTRFGGEMPL